MNRAIPLLTLLWIALLATATGGCTTQRFDAAAFDAMARWDPTNPVHRATPSPILLRLDDGSGLIETREPISAPLGNREMSIGTLPVVAHASPVKPAVRYSGSSAVERVRQALVAAARADEAEGAGATGTPLFSPRVRPAALRDKDLGHGLTLPALAAPAGAAWPLTTWWTVQGAALGCVGVAVYFLRRQPT